MGAITFTSSHRWGCQPSPLLTFEYWDSALWNENGPEKQYLTATERVNVSIRMKKINSDDEPTKTIRKKNASMVLAAKAVKEGEVGAISLLGTGDCLVGCKDSSLWSRIKNIDRQDVYLTDHWWKRLWHARRSQCRRNTAHHLPSRVPSMRKMFMGFRNRVLVCSTMEQKKQQKEIRFERKHTNLL